MEDNEQNPAVEGDNNAADDPIPDPEQQVFLNVVICEEIAKHLHSLRDLNSFRLVSKALYGASLPIWREAASISLGVDVGMNRFYEFMKNIDKLDLFHAYNMYSCSLPPVDMEEWDWYSGLYGHLIFWRDCGSNIRYLKLVGCRFDETRLLHLVCNLTPNLHTLKIEGCRDILEHMKVDQEFVQLNRQANLKVFHVSSYHTFSNWNFLEYFPSLVELKLSLDPDTNLIPTLCRLRRVYGGSILKLKILDLLQMDQSLVGLAQAHLTLEHLCVRLEKNERQHEIEDALVSQCDSLKSLKLFRFPLRGYIPYFSLFGDATFSSLTELYLRGQVLSNFTFLYQMPKLKTLVLDCYCYTIQKEIFSPVDGPIFANPDEMVSNTAIPLEVENFANLSLEYFQADFAFSDESLEMLGKWMPNLRVLKTILCDETLRVVCQQWKKLEELQCSFSSNVTDVGITGFTSTNGLDDRLPNISDLKELVKFEYECYCNWSKISDFSAHNAFLQTPSLKTLKVCSSPRLTERVEELLKACIENVEIKRNYGFDHFSRALCVYCRYGDFYVRNDTLLKEYQGDIIG